MDRSERKGLQRGSEKTAQKAPTETAKGTVISPSHLKELLTCGQLLSDHAGGGDHGKTSVVELLGLHILQLLRIFRLEAERVKAQVSWLVIFTDCPLCGTFQSRLLEGENRIDLRDRDCGHHRGPESL